jgi:hypothetical protein
VRQVAAAAPHRTPHMSFSSPPITHLQAPKAKKSKKSNKAAGGEEEVRESVVACQARQCAMRQPHSAFGPCAASLSLSYVELLPLLAFLIAGRQEEGPQEEGPQCAQGLLVILTPASE